MTFEIRRGLLTSKFSTALIASQIKTSDDHGVNVEIVAIGR